MKMLLLNIMIFIGKLFFNIVDLELGDNGFCKSIKFSYEEEIQEG